MHLRDYKTIKDRRNALEKELALRLPNIATYSLDDEQAGHKNCENMIGVAQVPMGIAGPILVEEKETYLPLATTEGALIASVSRGCKAISMSGGAYCETYRAGQTRGPVFAVANLKEMKSVYAWIEKNQVKLKQTAEATSSHLQFKSAMVKGVGLYLYVRFVFDTSDAMGMNMVTIASEAMGRLIESETSAKMLAVGGNFDIDKKPAWLNFINNRGFPTWAEAVIPKEIVNDVLKTTPEKVFEVWLAKCMIGSAMSGSMGFNSHYANIIAAIFLATGQDLAHVVEGSMGITVTKVLSSGDLYVSIYLPSLIIGTIGGGTALGTQQEALKILGVQGTGKVETFAKIIGSAVLAGELSLLASLSEGSLGKAHKELGRGEK